MLSACHISDVPVVFRELNGFNPTYAVRKGNAPTAGISFSEIYLCREQRRCGNQLGQKMRKARYDQGVINCCAVSGSVVSCCFCSRVSSRAFFWWSLWYKYPSCFSPNRQLSTWGTEDLFPVIAYCDHGYT